MSQTSSRRVIPFLSATFTPILFSVMRDGYTRKDFTRDFLAGLVIGVVALPLAIAFGIASGVTPAQGLITAVLAGFITALLGGSRTQVSGPTGAFIVILYAIIQEHGTDGLALATFMAGILLILMGIARFGKVLQFIPFPVIVGFTSGIAVIIATGQIPAFLGLTLAKDPSEWLDKIVVYAENISSVNSWTALVAAVSLFIVAMWPKLSSIESVRFLAKVPGSLVAIILATAAVQLFALPVVTIADKFGAVPSTIPHPHLPQVSSALIREMFQPALIIAILAGIESLLSAVVADGMTGYKHRSNMELIAHGVANLVTPIFGGIPSTGAIARTATNIRNGGRTPVSAMVHAVTLLLILLFFGRWAALIPMAALSAILMVVAYNMSEWRTFVKIFRAPKSDIMVLLATFLLTVLMDLMVAIEVGVVLASILFIKRMGEVSNVESVTGSLEDLDEEPLDPFNVESRKIPDGVVVYEVYGSFFFGAVEKFKSILAQMDNPPRVLIIRMRAVLSIDSSGLNFLEDVIARCRKENVHLILSHVNPQPLMAMTKQGLTESLGQKHFAENIDDALRRARLFLGLPMTSSPPPLPPPPTSSDE